MGGQNFSLNRPSHKKLFAKRQVNGGGVTPSKHGRALTSPFFNFLQILFDIRTPREKVMGVGQNFSLSRPSHKKLLAKRQVNGGGGLTQVNMGGD